jgi:hypothetical protein
MPFVSAPLTGNKPAAPQEEQAQATGSPVTAAKSTSSAVTPPLLSPPQGAGVPRRFRIDGAPAGQEKLNAAMKVLLDPTAHTLASRVYSGQRRDWNR